MKQKSKGQFSPGDYLIELESFSYHLVSEGRSAGTVKNLIGCIRLIDDPNDLGVVKKHLAHLILQKKYSQAHKTVNAIRCWGHYRGIEELTKLPYPKIKHKAIRAILTTEELKRVLECSPSTNTNIWHKYSVFFATVALSGARPGEVAKLTQYDIDWNNGFIHFYETKTGDSRKSPIPQKLHDILYPYAASVDDELLFRAMPGSKNTIKADGWGLNFRNRLEKCGIPRKRGLTVHSLRHQYITDLLRNGALLLDVQAIVGHSRAETTARYYHLSDEKLHETVQSLGLEREYVKPTEFFRLLSKRLSKSLEFMKPVSVVTDVKDLDDEVEFTYKVRVKKK